MKFNRYVSINFKLKWITVNNPKSWDINGYILFMSQANQESVSASTPTPGQGRGASRQNNAFVVKI